MSRRKKEHNGKGAIVDRKIRIAKLIAAGWIKSDAEIPSDAIPIDPDRPPLGGWDPPTYYRDLEFTCRDCRVQQTWTAEDQRWFFETAGAPYFKTAIRCRACRKKEQERKSLARIAAEHAKPKA